MPSFAPPLLGLPDARRLLPLPFALETAEYVLTLFHSMYPEQAPRTLSSANFNEGKREKPDKKVSLDNPLSTLPLDIRAKSLL